MLAHNAVTAAVLYKHHSIICVGTDLIQFVHWSHSYFATGVTSSKILFWPFCQASFYEFAPCSENQNVEESQSNFWTCKKNAVVQCRLPTNFCVQTLFLIGSQHFFNWKSALRSRILFASPEVVHRPSSDSHVHFDFQNIYQIRVGK